VNSNFSDFVFTFANVAWIAAIILILLAWTKNGKQKKEEVGLPVLVTFDGAYLAAVLWRVAVAEFVGEVLQ